MTNDQAGTLVGAYLPYLRPRGKVVFVVPQEAGFASDDTHVEFVDEETIARIEGRHRLQSISTASFPFPKPAGRVFTHNETVAVSRKT